MGLASLFRRRRSIKTRTDLLNHLIAARGYRRYLEIGVRNPRDNFEYVRAEVKHGVDPAPRRPVKFQMTSDAFFAGLAGAGGSGRYDLAFIDGLHLAEQVERDVVNCLMHLAPEGAIVLHDCNPTSERSQIESYEPGARWNGTVWKAWAKLRATRADLSMSVVDVDEGCGVIRRGLQRVIGLPSLDYAAMSYGLLEARRQEILNLVSVDRFLDSWGAGQPRGGGSLELEAEEPWQRA